MRRTTIVVDDDLLSQAQVALGTHGLKDTLDAALREAVRRSLRERLAARIERGDGIDRSPALLRETRPAR
jgi:Arc/MetJ family transcription regulator